MNGRKSHINLSIFSTTSLAAGFGRHGMPPPASNDAGIQHFVSGI